MINISNQSPCCLRTCEQFFPLERRSAQLGLEAVVKNAGGEATENEAPSRYTGQPNPDTQKQLLLILSRLALFHDLEIRELQAATFRTLLVKHDEPLMLPTKGATGLFVAKSKEGQRPPGEPHVHGWAAMMTAMTTDPSTLGGRQAESGDIHVQCDFTGDSLAEHLLEPVQKNISEGLGQVAVFSGLPDSAHLIPYIKSSGGQRSRASTYARRSVMQAGGKEGQTSWIRPKMPSIVKSGARDRRGQRLLTSWMRPKSSPAPTKSAAPVTAMEYISPAPKVCAATFPVVVISSPTLAASHAVTERLFFVRCTFCSQCPSRVRRVPLKEEALNPMCLWKGGQTFLARSCSSSDLLPV